MCKTGRVANENARIDCKFCSSDWYTSNCSFSHYFPAANGFSVVANAGSGAATPGHLQPPPTPPIIKMFPMGAE